MALDSDKCKARVWGAGLGGQCLNPPLQGGEFCGTHQKEWDKNGCLSHGRIDEEIPVRKQKEFESARRRAERHAANSLNEQEVEAKRALKAASRKLRHVQLAQQRISDHQASAQEEAGFARPMLSVVHGSSAEAALKGFCGGPKLYAPSVKPVCILPFTIIRGRLSEPLLKFLQDAPEWFRTYDDWVAMREKDARLMGFEKTAPAVEMYAHCLSQTSATRAPDQSLYGRDASQPAPQRLMAFRHALILLNGDRLRMLEEDIVQAMANRSDADVDLLGYGRTGLSLTRSAFSIATMQLRWGKRDSMHMSRHVDGGASILHLSVSLFGQRTLKCEVLGRKAQDGSYPVSVLSDELGPGDVYASSPACCYHSVDYAAQASEEAGQPPNTLVLHLRSNLLRLRHGPQYFHKSNSLMQEVIAPIVAKHLAEHPLQLPSLADVHYALASRCLGRNVD